MIVGLLGVGRMGAPIGATLARAGHDVLAFDVREEHRAAAPLRWARDAPALAREADVLLSSLPGSPELCEAMAPLVAALRAGTVWVDTTSAAPALAAPVVAAASARGVACLDAPLGGGPAQAASGALRLFVGGEAATLERVRELLAALGEVVHMGGPGAGYTTKLLVNLLWFGRAVATGEALLVAAREGLDLRLVGEALGGGEIVQALLAGDPMASFGLERCVEELDAVVALAGELPFELSSEVARAHRRALERFGARDGELLAVAALEERAGIRLSEAARPRPPQP